MRVDDKNGNQRLGRGKQAGVKGPRLGDVQPLIWFSARPIPSRPLDLRVCHQEVPWISHLCTSRSSLLCPKQVELCDSEANDYLALWITNPSCNSQQALLGTKYKLVFPVLPFTLPLNWLATQQIKLNVLSPSQPQGFLPSEAVGKHVAVSGRLGNQPLHLPLCFSTPGPLFPWQAKVFIFLTGSPPSSSTGEGLMTRSLRKTALLCSHCQFLWSTESHQSVLTEDRLGKKHTCGPWASASRLQYSPSPLEWVCYIPLTGSRDWMILTLPLITMAIHASLKVGSWIWGQEWLTILPVSQQNQYLSIPSCCTQAPHSGCLLRQQ